MSMQGPAVAKPEASRAIRSPVKNHRRDRKGMRGHTSADISPAALPPPISKRTAIRRALAPKPSQAHAHTDAMTRPTSAMTAVECATMRPPSDNATSPLALRTERYYNTNGE